MDTYVAHCLWELTFCGFTQEDIESRANELKEINDNFMKSLIENKTKE
jgi:hypothetical protein